MRLAAVAAVVSIGAFAATLVTTSHDAAPRAPRPVVLSEPPASRVLERPARLRAVDALPRALRERPAPAPATLAVAPAPAPLPTAEPTAVPTAEPTAVPTAVPTPPPIATEPPAAAPVAPPAEPQESFDDSGTFDSSG